MNNKQNHINEALLWQYFEGDVSLEVKVAINAWKTENPENEKLYTDTQKLFELTQIKVEQDTFNADIAWRKVSSKLNFENNKKEDNDPKVIPLTPKKSNHKTLWWAAAALIGIILSVNLVNQLNNPDWVYVTAENTIQEVTLEDGSIVSLKPGATLKYLENFNKKTREVHLIGDAFFDVARNESLPFTIQGNQVAVTVLGTEFLVKQSEGEKTEVMVQEGKVKMTSLKKSKKDPKEKGNEDAVVLEAGDKGVFKRASKKLVKEKNKDPNFLAWKTKILQFNKTDLKEVIKKIEEVYQVKITISKQEIQQCALTARFDNQSIDEIMQTLSLTLNLQIEKDGKVYTVDGAGC